MRCGGEAMKVSSWEQVKRSNLPTPTYIGAPADVNPAGSSQDCPIAYSSLVSGKAGIGTSWLLPAGLTSAGAPIYVGVGKLLRLPVPSWKLSLPPHHSASTPSWCPQLNYFQMPEDEHDSSAQQRHVTIQQRCDQANWLNLFRLLVVLRKAAKCLNFCGSVLKMGPFSIA